MEHLLTGSHLINGQWTRSAGATFNAQNPATGEKLSPPIGEAGDAEVNAALTAATEAFARSRDLPHAWQAILLDAIVTKIMDLGDALLVRAEQETALPRARLTGERARTCNQLKMFADLVREGSYVDATIDPAQPNRSPMPAPDLRRMSIARGPAVVFGASNFPFAFSVCGGDSASALAAGCPVVTKGHPSHPGTSELFAAAVLAALDELDYPRGLFAMVQGSTNALGAALVNHPATTAVGFTGSLRGGRALFNLAAARPTPIPVYAEMGSLNPAVILPAALAEKSEAIAAGFSASVLMGAGQFCTKPGLLFVVGDTRRDFVESLAKKMAASPSVTLLNMPLRNSFNQRTSEFAKLPGVKSLVAPQPASHAGVTPTLLETTVENWLHEPGLREEAFGPATIVVHCRDVRDAVAGVNIVEGSLTGTIHIGAGEKSDAVETIVRALSQVAGRIVVNGYPTGVEVNHAMVHGGPYPATTDSNSTSVGSAAIRRFTRLIAFQDAPQMILPPELKDENPMKIQRRVNGKLTDAPLVPSPSD